VSIKHFNKIETTMHPFYVAIIAASLITCGIVGACCMRRMCGVRPREHKESLHDAQKSTETENHVPRGAGDGADVDGFAYAQPTSTITTNASVHQLTTCISSAVDSDSESTGDMHSSALK
jgi:hypothetical protein